MSYHRNIRSLSFDHNIHISLLKTLEKPRPVDINYAFYKTEIFSQICVSPKYNAYSNKKYSDMYELECRNVANKSPCCKI